MNTLSQIKEHKLVAIIRGANPKDVIKIAAALYEGGIRIMEITMNSSNPLQVIEEVSAEFKNRMLIGAGTVLDAKTAKKAISAGARFIISPTLSKKTIKATKDLGAVSLPGAYTPTEILKAYKAGGDIIKVFPASLGASYIKDVLAPLSHIPLLPTGGINPDNIRDFQKAGAVGYGIGSSLVDTKKEITEEYLVQISNNARKFVDAITNHNQRS